jgi:cation diffusion facilitator family transporter
MALLADGLHMASHAAALGLSVIAYIYARRHASDPSFSFGTGKVNALAGYSSAVLLALFALLMAGESAGRLLQPQPIAFGQAMLVAALGLAVNGASLLLLRGADHPHGHDHGHVHGHDHDHGHDYGNAPHHAHGHRHGEDERPGAHDLNLRGAYLHVLADALTSVLALAALAAGALGGWFWPDAAVGLLGAVLVGRWALGLVRDSGAVLLDRGAPAVVQEQVRAAIEADGDSRVADLHIWSLGGDGYAAALAVVAHKPQTPEAYKSRFPATARIVHATIEVHRCEA